MISSRLIVDKNKDILVVHEESNFTSKDNENNNIAQRQQQQQVVDDTTTSSSIRISPKNIKQQKEHIMIVLVMSRRSSVERRDTIRETWGLGHDNIYFVIGNGCNIPIHLRKDDNTCVHYNSTSKVTTVEIISNISATIEQEKSEQLKWDENVRIMDKALEDEQMKHDDIIRIELVDVYHHLTQKLKLMFDWAITNTNAQWIVKADDDSFVRVASLQRYLTLTYNAYKPTVVGNILENKRVKKNGKWAEWIYEGKLYPKYPEGSSGYCVSRPIASYVVKNQYNLLNYTCEDSSLGIWLNASPMKDDIDWISLPAQFKKNGACNKKEALIMGHNIPMWKIRECYNMMDES